MIPNDSVDAPATAVPQAAVQAADHSRAMWCHLSAIAGVLFIIPFANVIAPLIVWLTTRDKDPEADLNGKEAVNFQITMSAIVVVIWILSTALSVVAIAASKGAGEVIAWAAVIVEWIAYLAVVAVWLTFVITASIRANQGLPYRYPISLRLIR